MNLAIREALARGIPVVVVGEQIDLAPTKGLSFVLDDIPEAGRLIVRISTLHSAAQKEGICSRF
jgi:ABC-type sugar transport system substrate-binding protein